MSPQVPTRLLILSDTHGEQLRHQIAADAKADVVIHCGDLTEESKLDEYRQAIQLLKAIDAPLKLIIAGNHDFTLDDNAYAHHLEYLHQTTDDDELVERTYGKLGDAKALLQSAEARDAGIVYLEEGTHHFDLENGAQLTVYTSPFTPSKSTGWSFQYNPEHGEHEWNLDQNVDVVMTHCPPKGVLDYTDGKVRAGSAPLFAAVATARPKVHCFGHVREAWGAKLVTWREGMPESPSHFTAIDNDESRLIESRATLRPGKFDTQEVLGQKQTKSREIERQGYRQVDLADLRPSQQTLFVNAAIEGVEEGQQQLPWLVDVNLSPR